MRKGAAKKRPTEVLGEQIKRMRQRSEMTAKYVADTAGIPRGSYHCLEAGDYRWNVDTLLRVQLVLQVPIEKLWPFYTPVVPDGVTEEVIALACRNARLAWMCRQAQGPGNG